MADQGPVCLIVDDALVDRKMMCRILSLQHPAPRVLSAASLAEARRHLSGHGVSLLFLDNMLPDGIGADFLAELATHRNWRRVPVVMVSDWPSPFMFDKARAANVLAVWSKGDFTPDRVRRIVRSQTVLH